MKLLIDSASNYLFLGLYGKEIKYFFRFGKCDHSETLTEYLDSFLKDNNISYKDIKEVYIGRGPGSYTGLRIAGTVGKTLSYLLNCPLYSFSSLDLLLSSTSCNGHYIALIEAKKTAVYLKEISITNGDITVINDDDFVEKVNLNTEGMTIIEATPELFDKGVLMIKNIIDKKLYQEESNFDYSPNYLRAAI